MNMRKSNRIPLSPCLKRFKYFFDLLKKTTDGYLFFMDLKQNTVMISPNLVQDFELPGEVLQDMDSYWAPLIHPEERGPYLASIRGITASHTLFEQAMEYRVRTRKGEYVWIRSRGRVGTDRDGNPELPYILGFFGAALLYWLLTLRTWPIRRSRASTAPEGITAGELGCRLTLTGGDLTMMVFSWAQLGYLLIAVEGNKVYLHKRMDMGNERSAFENKVFNLLFSRREAVDATGNQYAVLCRKVAGMVPMERNMYRGNSGNMKIFRLLGCLAQGACGVCVAMNMSPVLALAVVMAVILCFLGWISGWLMQDVAYCTHLRGKVPVAIGLVILILWTLLGLLSGQVWIPLGCILGQWVLGFFAAYGGRRSDLGRHDAGQVLGLRAYLKHLPRDGINRLLQNDPDYFFNMAPYALALGIIRPYADTFGRRKLEHCPYLFTRNDTGRRTAQEWGELMRSTALKMDARAKQMRIGRWFAVPLPKPKRR